MPKIAVPGVVEVADAARVSGGTEYRALKGVELFGQVDME